MNSAATTSPTATAPRSRAVVVLSWLAASLMLLAAWVVVDTIPTYADRVAPFAVATPVGEWGEGRDVKARAVDARFADSISELVGTFDGNWLVIDIEVTTTREIGSLEFATITVDGVTYGSDSPCCNSILHAPLTTGLPIAGSMVFPMPPELRSGSADLRIGLHADPSRDSVIVVPIDLDSLEQLDSFTMTEPDWATP